MPDLWEASPVHSAWEAECGEGWGRRGYIHLSGRGLGTQVPGDDRTCSSGHCDSGLEFGVGPGHCREPHPEFTRSIPGELPPSQWASLPSGGGSGGGMGRLSGRFSWGGGRGCSSLWGRAVPTCGALTCEEADTPQARVQGHLDLRALVLGQDHPLLQVEPVVGADCDAQEPQAADGKDAAQQGQRLPPAAAHLPRGRRAACGQGSGLWKQEWGGELTVAATALRRPRCGAWGRKLKSTPSG